jgi:hypothetical protein
VDKAGVGEIVADGAYATETNKDELPMGQRLPKRLKKLEAKARNGKYFGKDFVEGSGFSQGSEDAISNKGALLTQDMFEGLDSTQEVGVAFD